MKLHCAYLVSILTVLALSAFAADEHKHKEAEKHAGHGDKKVEVAIPENAGALWAEIDLKAKVLADLVAAKKADGMHEAAKTVEALVNAIPSKHASLAADKLKRVEGMAKNIARALEQLHEAAEEGHWDEAGQKLAQAQSALQLIKDQTKS